MPWCRRPDRAWSVAFAVGGYEGDLRRAIIAYKHRGERWRAPALAGLLVGYLDRHAGWLDDFDAVVAVPAYTGPGARRGWDPVGELLGRVGEVAGAAWPVLPGAVVKRAETAPLGRAGGAARLRLAACELRPTLHVPDPARVAGRRVLLLDDVLAEGSTLQEVAHALRSAGAEEVAGLVLAQARWWGRPRRVGASAPAARVGPPGGAVAAGGRPGRGWPGPTRL